MYGLAAAALDALHALFMVLQVVGLPLFFWHRWPRLTRAYAIYAITFIALNQLSKYLLGECFLTTLARLLWARAVIDPGDVPAEWFTVRLAQWVFHMTPSHRAVALAGEALMLVTAVGVLVWRRHVRAERRSRPSPEAARADRAARPPARRDGSVPMHGAAGHAG